MSVIMTLRVKGSPEKLEQLAEKDAGRLRAIADHAKEHGVIAHRFYGGEGEILVIDEWPDAQSFQDFFAHMRSDIEAMMGEIGVTSEPEIRFWENLETGDEIGWDA